MAEVRKPESTQADLAAIEKRLREVEAMCSRFPDQPVSWELSNQFVPVTSGVFVPTHHMELPRYDNPVLNVRLVVTCDAATSGELRIRQELSAAATAVAVVGPGASQQFVDFEWLHDIHLGDTYEHFLIEARRTAGAGNVNVYYPRRSILTTALRLPSAAADGNPTVT